VTTQTRPPGARGGARPAGRPPLTDQDAAWIRDHAIPTAIRRTAGPSGCPCQWGGPTGHCRHGAHDRCRSTEPIVYPAGWVTWPNGYVASPAPSNDVQIWRTGRPCALPPCSCTCHTAPPEPVQPVQLDLFGAVT
jgi:hypothetical protein